MAVSPAKHAHLKSIAQQGGYARTAKLGRKGSAEPLHRGFLEKFEREADEKFGPFLKPNGEPDLEERRWRAGMLLKAHMADLARRSARARARKPSAGTGRP